MDKRLEVSFNSPQCGWMSIGFDNGESEFHTTTAHTPHSRALAEILECLASMLESKNKKEEHKIAWSRNPEAYHLFFTLYEGVVHFQVVEYPTIGHRPAEGTIVFSHQEPVRNFCESFYATFAQLYADRETDEFEFHWRQPFPFEEYKNFENKLKRNGQ